MSRTETGKNDLSAAFSALSALVTRLRGPGGCPWDARQTYETVKVYLLEEAYEVLDAMEGGSPDDLCGEIGDLLFQLLFLAGIAEDRGEFDLQDVIEAITEKMIRRHPHVFGGKTVAGPEEVAENWAKIKREENCSAETTSSLLRKVPANLPALMRAGRLIQRASEFRTGALQTEEIWPGVEQRFEELKKSVLDGDREGIGSKTGDLLFALVHLGRSWDLNAEDLLRAANRRFVEQIEKAEEKVGP